MPWQTEGKYISDVVKYEIIEYSRDTAIVAGGAASESTLDIGTVLGQNATSGKFLPLNPSAVTGEQVAAGILLQKISVSSTATVNALVLRRHATIAPSGLIFPAAATDAQKKAALGELAALGIITREEA
jgi:hypothetical protein